MPKPGEKGSSFIILVLIFAVMVITGGIVLYKTLIISTKELTQTSKPASNYSPFPTYTPYPRYSPNTTGNIGTHSTIKGVSAVRSLLDRIMDVFC